MLASTLKTIAPKTLALRTLLLVGLNDRCLVRRFANGRRPVWWIADSDRSRWLWRLLRERLQLVDSVWRRSLDSANFTRVHGSRLQHRISRLLWLLGDSRPGRLWRNAFRLPKPHLFKSELSHLRLQRIRPLFGRWRSKLPAAIGSVPIARARSSIATLFSTSFTLFSAGFTLPFAAILPSTAHDRSKTWMIFAREWFCLTAQRSSQSIHPARPTQAQLTHSQRQHPPIQFRPRPTVPESPIAHRSRN